MLQPQEPFNFPYFPSPKLPEPKPSFQILTPPTPNLIPTECLRISASESLLNSQMARPSHSTIRSLIAPHPPGLSLVLRNALPQPPRTFATTAPRTGYVFDIDGVLLRGPVVLPAGRAAMKLLHSPTAGWRAPVAFLTNGGGHSEAARADLLARLLDVPVEAEQVVLAHSPMRPLAAEFGTPASPRAVVTVGGPMCPAVARSYGFTNVIDIGRVGLARGQPATPFASYDNAPHLSEEEERIAALPVGLALVMHDSGANFQRDLQLLVDFVEEDSAARPEDLTIVFSNPDIVFPNTYPRPRLAGGTLRIALDAILQSAKDGLRRSAYRPVQLGKPNVANYALAEEALMRQVVDVDSRESLPAASDIFEAIYMVGDNPPSDVCCFITVNFASPLFCTIASLFLFV